MKKQIKIAFTGPESSGKTTLAKKVTATYNGFFVEEFARTFLEGKSTYVQEDLEAIAEGQVKSWDIETEFLIADTEMTVICIWSLYKYRAISQKIKQLFDQQQFDLLFLCKPDIPWEFDPMRENPENRAELFDLYHSFLTENKQNFVVIEGDEQQRHLIVVEALSAFI